MKYLLQSICIFGLVACANDPIPGPPPSYGEDIYSSIRDTINSLHKESKAKWTESAGLSEEIKSRKQLEILLEPIEYAEEERVMIFDYYTRAASVMHYGFDGNFHAVVFFDSRDQPLHVEKW